MHSRNDAPHHHNSGDGCGVEGRYVPFPPLVEQDPCLILSGYVERYASIMKKKKK